MNVDENGSASSEAPNSVQPENEDDKVAYSTYRKVLSEKKRRDQELEDLKKELSNRDLEKQQAAGEKDKVIESLRSQLNETEDKLKNKDRSYIWNVVSGQVKAKAASMGCENPDKLLKLIDKVEFETLEVGDNFDVNGEDLERLLTKAKDENSFLFPKKASGVKDLHPSDPPKPQPKTLSKMSDEELMKKLKQMS